MGKHTIFSKYSISSPPLTSPATTTTTNLKKTSSSIVPSIIGCTSYVNSNRIKQPEIKTVVNVAK